MPGSDAKWGIGPTDMLSYTADGEPVHFLYPPGNGNSIPFYGDECIERAEQIADLLNRADDRIRACRARIDAEKARADEAERRMRCAERAALSQAQRADAQCIQAVDQTEAATVLHKRIAELEAALNNLIAELEAALNNLIAAHGAVAMVTLATKRAREVLEVG